MLTLMSATAVIVLLGVWTCAAVSLVNTHSPLTRASLPVKCPRVNCSATAEIARNGRMHIVGCTALPWLENGGCEELCLCEAKTFALGNSLCDAIEEETEVPVSVLA